VSALLEAAAQWRVYADSYGITAGMRDTALRAAKSLEMEADDGIARCCCCFKPRNKPDTAMFPWLKGAA
jgi:hypothetical protein